MSEPDADGQDKLNASPVADAEAVPQSGATTGGGKTMTVFGALFGAAAAVPT